ncbi:hypothetical protein [Campylobacter mucosalis]|uniref:Uncharacterized protein n=1 Tax=Campylobacter mucosalis CCUG 21559 TaxID=1032067 RepID=A0A6G5QFP5_9BACT|nr:hypothetical protein [Campylobacter mucosalis]QCD44471.1 hypothetical protein CMUC_0672 [Campylobacter mucosalis CCUG 21559]
MALKKLERTKEIYTFSDGQEVLLTAPSLGQIRNAQNAKNETEQLIKLLVDMSNGEMDEAFINSLPIDEVNKLAVIVSKLSGVTDLKN